MTTSNAAFKIRNLTTAGDWSPFSDRGFDCDFGDVLEVQLENQPALSVTIGQFSTVKSSLDAASLSYENDGVLTSPTNTLQVFAPESSPGVTAHSWIIRSMTNNGEAVLVNNRSDYTINTAERMISIRSGGLRKVLPTEQDQYSPSGGWADAQNEELEAVASVVALVGTGFTSLETRVSTEESARTSGDTSLSTRVSTEESARASTATSLTTRLSTEESARALADSSLTTRISGEESARASGDTSLTTRISGEESSRASGDTSLATAISSTESATTSLTTRVSAVESRTTILEIPGHDYAYIPPRMAAASGAAATRNSPGSSYTHGVSFYVTKACYCVGVSGYWVPSGTESVRGELWSPAGASLANASVSVSASGIWSVTFSSSVLLKSYQLYHATQCVSGSNATTTYNHGTTGISTFSPPIIAGHGLIFNSIMRHNTAANTFPNTTGGTFYPVTPVLG